MLHARAQRLEGTDLMPLSSKYYSRCRHPGPDPSARCAVLLRTCCSSSALALCSCSACCAAWRSCLCCCSSSSSCWAAACISAHAVRSSAACRYQVRRGGGVHAAKLCMRSPPIPCPTASTHMGHGTRPSSSKKVLCRRPTCALSLSHSRASS